MTPIMFSPAFNPAVTRLLSSPRLRQSQAISRQWIPSRAASRWAGSRARARSQAALASARRLARACSLAWAYQSLASWGAGSGMGPVRAGTTVWWGWVGPEHTETYILLLQLRKPHPVAKASLGPADRAW